MVLVGSVLLYLSCAQVIDSDTFGALASEPCCAEANHHNVDLLLPRFIKTRGFADADDAASVLHPGSRTPPPAPQTPDTPARCRVLSSASFPKPSVP